MHDNQYYKNAALARLRGNWSPVIVATIIYLLISILVSGLDLVKTGTDVSAFPVGTFFLSGVSTVLMFFVLCPLGVGYNNAARLMYETGNVSVAGNMWMFATNNYLHKVLGMLFMTLKLLLWTCLLIVPGLVMSFAYAMTPYILEENPEISAWEASTRSREMMKGHKFDLFYLYLSFIGWIILSCITFGIGFIWLVPYMQLSIAAFYNDLKGGDGNPTIVVG
jgi:uncharacterized membrane protein